MKPYSKKAITEPSELDHFTSPDSMNQQSGITQFRNCCLYITQADLVSNNAVPAFDAYVMAYGFDHATQLIQSAISSELNQPDLIIIDMPLQPEQLAQFVQFKNAQGWSVLIPVVYNEAHLSHSQVQVLLNRQLVDDIVHLNQHGDALVNKARFLKNTKLFLHAAATAKNPPISLSAIRQKTVYGFNFFVKRLIDVTLASLAILILLPVMLLIMICIKLESKGPAIYKSKRAGRGFKIFNFYKFRTMVQDADKRVEEMAELNLYGEGTEPGAPTFFKALNDPRVTKVGGFLRNSSLDELPQLFNVLKGDMSIVGNRPLPLYEAATLTTDEWAERFMAPAGITGLWQVKKRGQKDMSAEERIDLDIDYARNHNLAKDFWILAQTPSALFQKANV